MRNNKGFSLVELIVVIAIMAILAAVAIPTFATFIGKAQQASDVDFMNQVVSAVELAYATDPVDYDTIEVIYDKTTKVPVSITIKKGNEEVDSFTKDGGDTTQADDAALVIDWKYEFKAPDKATHDKNENWSTGWSLKSN